MSNLPSSIPILIRVPANFDATSLAKLHRKRNGDIQLLADRLNWFVSQLVSVGMRQDKRKELDETGFVTLSTEAFLEVFLSPSTTNSVIQILDDVLFERNHSYQVDNYSKGYRLLPEYLGAGIKTVEITSLSMRKAVRKFLGKLDGEKKERTRSISPLTKFIEDPELKIDVYKSHSFLEFWAHDLKQKLTDDDSDLNSDIKHELGHRVMTKIYYQKELFRRISNKEVWYNRDISGLRLHSSYTGLKSPLRNYLTYRGQELVSVDLKASQPYLFTRLLQPDFWKKSDDSTPTPYTLGSLHPNLYDTLSNTGTLEAIIMFTETLQTEYGSGLQGLSYQEIPWNEDFYTLLMHQTQLDFSDHKDVLKCYESRKRTKYHNMLLFFDTKVVGKDTFRVPFETYFPGVLRLMDLIRRTPGVPKTYNGKFGKKVKNNNLPILLQRLESRLILDEICPAILKDYPDLFLLTIHDSIITVKGKEHIVMDYMAQILEYRIGKKPGLKREELNPSVVTSEWDAFIQEEWDEMIIAMHTRKRKSSSRSVLAGKETQIMLEALSKLGTDPLLLNVLPEQRGLKIVSTGYVDAALYLEDYWVEE